MGMSQACKDVNFALKGSYSSRIRASQRFYSNKRSMPPNLIHLHAMAGHAFDFLCNLLTLFATRMSTCTIACR